MSGDIHQILSFNQHSTGSPPPPHHHHIDGVSMSRMQISSKSSTGMGADTKTRTSTTSIEQHNFLVTASSGTYEKGMVKNASTNNFRHNLQKQSPNYANNTMSTEIATTYANNHKNN